LHLFAERFCFEFSIPPMDQVALRYWFRTRGPLPSFPLTLATVSFFKSTLDSSQQRRFVFAAHLAPFPRAGFLSMEFLQGCAACLQKSGSDANVIFLFSRGFPFSPFPEEGPCVLYKNSLRPFPPFVDLAFAEDPAPAGPFLAKKGTTPWVVTPRCLRIPTAPGERAYPPLPCLFRYPPIPCPFCPPFFQDDPAVPVREYDIRDARGEQQTAVLRPEGFCICAPQFH